jgi:hypothetical protein
MRPCPSAERARPLAAALLWLALARPGAAQEAEPTTESWPTPAREPTPEPGPRLLSGLLLTRYRGRFTGDESDHDLYQTLDLTVTDPAGRFTGALLARAAWDVDGRDAGEDEEFFGLLDTYDHAFEPQLYHAYVDWKVDSLALLRFGRQPLYETPVTVFLDGVRADVATRDHRAQAGVYAGAGEHMYESSNDGDVVLGTFAAARAWKGSELRADWMRLEDARLGVDHENDLFGLALSQDLVHGEDLGRLDARFTSLETSGRDLRLTGNWLDGEGAFSVRGSYYRLLQTQKSLAAPLDPFSDTLFELFPYDQLGVSATKDWERVGLLAGSDVRRVREDSDEGTYNRDFERYFVTGTLRDTLPVDLSLTGELWDASEDEYETWGASLARAFPEGWDAVIGSYYSLYEYDLLSGDERDHVRTTYIDLRWKRSASQRWTLRYELERNDFDDFHELRLDYGWNF